MRGVFDSVVKPVYEDWELVSEHCGSLAAAYEGRASELDEDRATADKAKAAEYRAKALLASYLFQGQPPPPDEYTKKHYEQTLEDTESWLKYEEGETRSVSERFWEPLEKAKERQGLKDFILKRESGLWLPSAPRQKDLGDPGSSYVSAVREVAALMAGRFRDGEEQ